MLIDAYTVVPTSEVEFKFECDCDSGIIKKVVRYDLLSTKLGDKDLYHLAFGPYTEDGKILDSKKTNTNDLLKTLVTVAKTSIYFTDAYTNVVIYAKGYNEARTRLYQIHIHKFYDEIHENFIIYGLRKNYPYELFKKERNYNYEAFLAERKIH